MKNVVPPMTCLLVVAIMLYAPEKLVAQDSMFVQEAFIKWQNAAAYTLETARLMPEDQFGFKPVPEEMSFGEQLAHIGKNMVWLAGGHLTGKTFEHPLTAKEHRTPAEEIELLEASLTYAEEAIQQTSPDSLAVKGDFFAGPKSKRQIIMLMHDHMTHHRGQIIVYLRLQNIKPPKYRGW
ncbi:MAG: DinB family protein [Saprospiraceae bacterium]|nr:DinB family protein [Saprospiraceae bacterium]